MALEPGGLKLLCFPGDAIQSAFLVWGERNYAHVLLSDEIIRQLNAETSRQSLAEEIGGIGYPNL